MNRLSRESSPYLLQHKDNPVDWYPWSAEALEKARTGNKPILLSIGYSTCHWCHVMAHECFEDEEVASVMNRLFINIKVDREERPDLDQIYQAAHQILTRRAGGWPLTVFLTPDQIPFFAGTYFPKQPRYNLPGFVDLLQQVARAFSEKPDEIAAQNQELLDLLAAHEPRREGPAGFDRQPVEDALTQWKQGFDPVWGGFSPAPKFPRPGEIAFLLNQNDAKPRQMALFTLEKMLTGGLIDHLGGGFFRYSVDERWAIPHFEKMLYDNGPLLGLMAEAWQITGDTRYREAAEKTVDWLNCEMSSPQGGFYSAQDADTEHEEGKFYVWTPKEMRAVLTESEWRVAGKAYALDAPANFEQRHWHLQCPHSRPALSSMLDLSEAEIVTLLESARQKLFAVRATRVAPGRDDKILTSWNALTIKGLAHAGRVMQRPEWVTRAAQAIDFLKHEAWKDGRLFANVPTKGKLLPGYLDDYALVLDALLELMRTDFRAADMVWAQGLAEALLAHFEDSAEGGFYFTSHDHETLIHRSKPGYDQATPSGNAVAARALWQLGCLLEEPRYSAAAERVLTLFWPDVSQTPIAHPGMLAFLQDVLMPPAQVVVRGPEPELSLWKRHFARYPQALCWFIPNGITGLSGVLEKPESSRLKAWVCLGQQCLPPVDNIEALEAVLHPE